VVLNDQSDPGYTWKENC